MSDELNNAGNPVIDRLISNMDTEEKAMARSEAMRAAAEQFNSGAPIPSVNASDLKQLWHANRRINADMPSSSGGAVGLAAYAAYGFEACGSPKCYPPRVALILSRPKREL